MSVRENQGRQIINSLIGRTAAVTLDPTLMLNKEDWSKLLKDKEKGDKFIYLYMLDYAYDPKPYIFHLVKYYSEKMKLKVFSNVNIPKSFGIDYVNVSDAGIEDFLFYTCNAALVITSSFHGTAFAVNFGTPLLSVVPKKGKDDRLSSLLHNLGLDDNIVEIDSPFNNLSPYYDVDREQKQLDLMRTQSLNFVRRALKDIK